MRRREFILGGLALGLGFPAAAKAGWGKGGKPKPVTTTELPTTTTTVPTTTTTAAVTTTTTPGRLNIMDYGAHGDGVTTDSDHLATAVADAVSKGKTLYVPEPPVAYLLGANVALPSHLAMEGDGFASLFTSTSTASALSIPGRTNVSLANFAIRMNRNLAVAQKAISVTGTNSHLTFEGLAISDVGYAGILFGYQCYADYITFRNSIFTNCGFAGIQSGTAGVASGGTGSLIEDCIFDGMGGTNYDYPAHGVYLHNWNALTARRCASSGILQSIAKNGWSCYEWDNCLDLTVDDCVAYDANPRASGPGGGDGFTFVGNTTGVVTNCTATTGLRNGFFKLAQSGTLTIDGSNAGSVFVYP